MNHPTPKVSILLPNLNQRLFLEERLQSIRNQTFSDWELVIVDNHSDDGSWEFFQGLPEHDVRIRIFQAPRRGMYDNWNNCLCLARGEYVYIATSDDTMDPDFLERMVWALSENPECDLAHCKLRIIDERGEPRFDFNWDVFYCVRFFREWIDREHIRRAPHDGILHCAVRTVYTSITQLVMRRRLFDRVGLFSTDFGSAADFEWGMRASLVAHTVHVPLRLATWRVHGRQGTDMGHLDSPGQKRLLIRMVRRAFRRARRIDPAGLQRLRLSDLTYLYRKERLCATLKEERRRRAPGPVPLHRKIGIGLYWLCRDPLVFLEFYRCRRDVKNFLPANAPLVYARQLLAKYGLGGNLADCRPRVAAGQPCPVLLPESMDFTQWPLRDRRTVEAMKKTHPWLFNDPPPVELDVERFPVLIYQMGKVGSTSVDFTLKKSGFPHPVYHVHQLHPDGIARTVHDTRESLERTLRNRALDSHTRVINCLYLRLVLREYEQNLVLYNEIRANFDRIPWHIITLVRDPVMREISDFFFSLHLYPALLTLSGEPLRQECLRTLADDLRKKFRAPSPWVLSWFDSELGRVFDIDVYSFPFDLQKGYSILEAGNTRVLVLKLERLSECFSEAMERFLKIRDLGLINQNTARQKHYYETYRHVLDSISLDADLCRSIYQSKYCRHFYSEEERNDCIRRWTARAGKATAEEAKHDLKVQAEPLPQADNPTIPAAGRLKDVAKGSHGQSVKGSRDLRGDVAKLEEQLTQLGEALAFEAQTAKGRAKAVEALTAQLEEKMEAIALLESKVNILLNSHSFRIGKSILFPLSKAKKFVFKLKKMRPGAWTPRAAGTAHELAQSLERKISVIEQLGQDFGRHRSGLKYGLRYLLRLHHPRGVLLDAFIEKTFSWQPQRKISYDRPWVGFIHVPPRLPEWFHPQVSNEAIFRSEPWQKSLPFCRGLFAFSRYHQRHLKDQLPVPVEVLRLTSEVPCLIWSWEAFMANPSRKIVQVGWWLRKLHAIYQMPRTPFKKVFLHVGHSSLNELMAKEKELMSREGTFHHVDLDSAEIIPFLSNDEYDRLLSRNIVFMELYDSSACNAIVECMVRHTPVLINPLEAVVEYLGEKYPFYFDSLEEAAEKAMSQDLVYQTHEYLRRLSHQQELTGEHFFKTFKESEIYRSLALPMGS